MKVMILHHDLEDNEPKIKELLEQKGISVELMDVRDVNISDFEEADVILNRVYASVANRDYASIVKTLSLLKELEEKGKYCLNSYSTSFYDYHKFETYKLLKENGIYTPESLLITSKEEIDQICEEAEVKLKFPVVSKRDTGGRGKDVAKVYSKEELKKDLLDKFKSADSGNYFGGFIIQEFIKSGRNHDFRLGIVDGKFVLAFGRTLIPFNSEDCWLASTSNGSKKIEYEPSEEEKNLSIATSKLIGAEFNEMDVLVDTQGRACIIENNPTPNYVLKNNEDLGKLTAFVDKIAEKIQQIKGDN